MLSTTVTQKENTVFIEGALTFETVKGVFDSTHYLISPPFIEIDLANVTSVDSAGLALIINWFKIAKSHQVEIRYTHIPMKLITLARANGLSALLPTS